MKRILGALVFLAVPLFSSDPAVSVKKLVEFIESSIKQKYPDKEVAKYVANMKLSEKLPDSTIETLQTDGAGPKTVAALKDLAETSSGRMAPVVVSTDAPKPGPQQPPAPSYDEAQQVISEMTDYALNYTQRLPDFLCTQVTRRSAQPRGHDGWIKLDTVVSKVSYVEGHEKYEVKLVNDTMVSNKSLEQLDGSISTGEFGSMMHQVFDSMSGAEFHFDHWGTLRGKLMYVFTYAIEQDRSKYSIDFNHKQRIITAYQGKVYFDKASHTISRITAEAVEIPSDFPVRKATEVLDYESQTIGTRDFVVPISAVMNIGDSEATFQNKIEFRSYRRFGADSSIKYDDIPEPLDSSKTTEEPIKPVSPK